MNAAPSPIVLLAAAGLAAALAPVAHAGVTEALSSVLATRPDSSLCYEGHWRRVRRAPVTGELRSHGAGRRSNGMTPT